MVTNQADAQNNWGRSSTSENLLQSQAMVAYTCNIISPQRQRQIGCFEFGVMELQASLGDQVRVCQNNHCVKDNVSGALKRYNTNCLTVSTFQRFKLVRARNSAMPQMHLAAEARHKDRSRTRNGSRKEKELRKISPGRNPPINTAGSKDVF